MYVFDLCVNGYRIDFPYLTGIEWLLDGDGVRKNERGAPKAVRDGRRQPTLGSVLPVRSSKPTISGQTVVAAEFYGDPEQCPDRELLSTSLLLSPRGPSAHGRSSVGQAGPIRQPLVRWNSGYRPEPVLGLV